MDFGEIKNADNFANKALNEERSSISDQAKAPPVTTVDFAKKDMNFCMWAKNARNCAFCRRNALLLIALM